MTHLLCRSRPQRVIWTSQTHWIIFKLSQTHTRMRYASLLYAHTVSHLHVTNSLSHQNITDQHSHPWHVAPPLFYVHRVSKIPQTHWVIKISRTRTRMRDVLHLLRRMRPQWVIKMSRTHRVTQTSRTHTRRCDRSHLPQSCKMVSLSVSVLCALNESSNLTNSLTQWQSGSSKALSVSVLFACNESSPLHTLTLICVTCLIFLIRAKWAESFQPLSVSVLCALNESSKSRELTLTNTHYDSNVYEMFWVNQISRTYSHELNLRQ